MKKDYRPYQQGDVLIKPLASLPSKQFKSVAPVRGSLVLAEGEVTGHFHGIEFDPSNVALLEDIDTKALYLEVFGDTATVKHQEHGPVTVEKGVYEIGIVQEYDHFAEAARRVQD